MRNAITVSALLLASVVIAGVTAAQTSAQQITITPAASQNVIYGLPQAIYRFCSCAVALRSN